MKKNLLVLLFFATYTSLLAQFSIGNSSFSFTDPARSNRTVNGQIYYPATTTGSNTAIASGVFPLIVFGHGFAMQYSEYPSIWDSLASRGYIVALPKTESAAIPFPNHENFAKDLSFVVNKYFSENTNSSSFFHQKINGKSAIMGHSMGGGASVYATAYNSNVTTMVTLAPVNTNAPVQSTVHAKNIKQPVLMLAGSEDCVANGAQSTGNADSIYNHLDSAIYKVVATITGADHCDFASAAGATCQFGQASCVGSISAAVQQQRTFQLIVPWLNYHLKGICSEWTHFKTVLTTAPATTHTYRSSLTLPLTNAPTIAANGNLSFCNGDSVVLQATVAGANCGLKWYKNGQDFGLSTTSITVATAGSYTAFSLNADNVLSPTSNTITVVVNPLPTPTITSNNTILSTQNFASYQWYLNGAPISGANQQNFTPTVSGNYTVEVTSAQNCKATSAAQAIVINSIEELNRYFSIQNPIHEKLQITSATNFTVRIFDMAGKEIATLSESAKSFAINTDNWAKGLYLLHLQNNIGKFSTKIIKE